MMLDVAGYRARRTATLENLAERLLSECWNGGVPVA